MARGNESDYTEKPMTKMEAMRRTLALLGQDAKPLDIQSHVLSKYGLDMNTNTISAYKSTLKMVKKPAVESTPTAKAPAPKTESGISVEDVRAIKELADRIGADMVKELVEVLGN